MTSNEFTVDQLVRAIRSADTLKELKVMVGPTPEQNEAARSRMEEMDRIWENHGSDMGAWPWSALRRHERLVEEQDEFEAEFC